MFNWTQYKLRFRNVEYSPLELHTVKYSLYFTLSSNYRHVTRMRGINQALADQGNLGHLYLMKKRHSTGYNMLNKSNIHTLYCKEVYNDIKGGK